MDFPALFQDRTALVLGLGDSGLAMAAWAARLGARVTVWDSREQPPQLVTLRERLPQADFIHGALSAETVSGLLDAQALVFKSPGLSPLDERLKPVYEGAAALGLRVQGELDLFAQALAELKQLYRYAPGVLAITGTNGKTTTTSMTALLAERAGRRVAMAGNIGPTLLGTLADALDREPQPQQPSADAEPGDASEALASAEAATEPVTDSGADRAAEAASSAPAATPSGDSAESIDPLEQAPVGEVAPSSDTAVATEAPSATSVGAANTPTSETPGAADLQSAALSSDAASRASVAVPAPVQPDDAADADIDATAAEPAPPADALAQSANASAASVETPAAAEPDTRNVLDTVAELLDEAPLPIKPPPPRAPDFDVLPQVWVLELSSFQLDGVVGFEPSAAAVLNITQDHLDWHGDMPSYARAKGRIFGEQAVMVINRDDPEVEALVPAPVQVKQGRGRPSKLVERHVVRFGLDAPRRPGDFGLVVENGMAWLVRARELEEGVKRRKGEEEEPISLQRLMPADALRVRGRHNAANALAALALASSIDCPLAPMLHGLREYRGEPHRVEFVTSIQGVDFYDDSKGTNVGATVAAILGLGVDRAPAQLVMILGGDGKGQDFSPLATPIAVHTRAVALIGRDAAQIEAALADTGVPMQRHESLEAATRWALAQAHAGDSVLLSPACASLDMFRNYAHRAEVFIQTVHELAQDQGLIG
ncbi:UDP-N-acetylmuramoyl-L-alanine--D-glutamate ligase [Roseateles terrae]|uniref:UDP-N-acetylmuramoylalanine--D-glutamate ligase n=1 Tax=Roseateles terrae TaxID=431060 RepID=A0ABR6GYK2_9BURK|nr:UDP-N-acetylmuramoyl-L-alanine--D-glutamate ligase [Roseateles terrae]MBB3197139.1 UDP-N-acetylmuramoylalanine--D-glutamate ligase [Roseateles terrae]OWQ84291.1 UDP-N-acetylmuramoyl-L-alanine--D-glutamate ligase [Roseateles terrae]